MSDVEKTMLAEITSATAFLSAPTETALVKALSNFLGGAAAIPAAFWKRKAQAIDDVTNARSVVAATIAKGVADNALKDPALMLAAADVFLPDAVRKMQNKVDVAKLAIQHVAAQASDSNTPAPPDDDWMNTFGRFAEDASSEKLQDLFARILAGEVAKPGSFARATIRVVSELDREIAEDFTLMWARSVGRAVDHDDDFRVGEWFSRWRRLAEAGLMSPDAESQFTPEFNPTFYGDFALWSPMSAEDLFTMAYFAKGDAPQWTHISFTKVGRQLGSILAKPDYEANMRMAGRRLGERYGLQVDLFSKGKLFEHLTARRQG
ncbi:DUF2806 domain-containing protein [Agrobacterium deltaense]|uniref:DUF2806 domain-containing protein n=1 Tax=Agrobacterium deltaense TaxID=1183412 RepID=UPI003FD68DB8